MRRYKWILLLLIVVVLGGCSKSSGMTRYEAQFLNLFDTMTEMVGYSESEEDFKTQIQLLYDELDVYHKLYDIYNDYDGISNIKTINENAGIEPVVVDKKIIDLLLLGKEMYQTTNGKVNIAMGSVLSIWHDYRTEGLDDPEHAKLPEIEELEEAAKHTDIDNVIIDEEKSTVYLEDKEMSLDVGSLGKGYAVQQLTEYAKAQGMKNLLISVGGNISAIDTRIDGTPWKLGIQNPDTESEEAYVMKVNMENQSLVTSGNYQRYYVVDGKRYHHIINPDTLMPADYFAAVSILNQDSGVADALSTAVYNMPYEEGLSLIESIPDTEAVWIYEDGAIAYSSGFEDSVAD